MDGVARSTGDFQEDGGRSGLGVGKAGSGAPKAMSETQISEPQTSGSCPADNQIDKHRTPGRTESALSVSEPPARTGDTLGIVTSSYLLRVLGRSVKVK